MDGKSTYSEVLQVLQGPCGDFGVDLAGLGKLVDPWVLEGIESRNSFFGVESQELCDEVFGFGGNIGPLWLVDGVLAREHGLNYLLVSAAVEGRVAAKQDVEDDTAAPKIALLVVTFFQNFGRDVVRGAILLTHLFIRVKHARSAKVNNGDAWILALFVKKKVLWFQIAMHDVARVAVVNCGEDLFDDVCCVFLAEELFRGDELEKLSTIAESIQKKISG